MEKNRLPGWRRGGVPWRWYGSWSSRSVGSPRHQELSSSCSQSAAAAERAWVPPWAARRTSWYYGCTPPARETRETRTRVLAPTGSLTRAEFRLYSFDSDLVLYFVKRKKKAIFFIYFYPIIDFQFGVGSVWKSNILVKKKMWGWRETFEQIFIFINKWRESKELCCCWVYWRIHVLIFLKKIKGGWDLIKRICFWLNDYGFISWLELNFVFLA